MPHILIIVGLCFIAFAILVKLVSAIVAIAIPAGVLLLIAGIIWHLVDTARRGQSPPP